VSAPRVRVFKQQRPEAMLGPHGFVGDRHGVEFGAYGRPNQRQWSAVSTEEVAELCADIGIEMPFEPGAMGENLRLAGLRLSEVPAGSVLEFPSGARLRVAGRNDPCVNAALELSRTYGPAVGRYFVKQAFGRRGILGTVLATGVVRVGDEVRVVLPAEAATTELTDGANSPR
jgi:MOSC domain-containing protein YiiM